jgi:hypothetical protein
MRSQLKISASTWYSRKSFVGHSEKDGAECMASALICRVLLHLQVEVKAVRVTVLQLRFEDHLLQDRFLGRS